MASTSPQSLEFMLVPPHQVVRLWRALGASSIHGSHKSDRCSVSEGNPRSWQWSVPVAGHARYTFGIQSTAFIMSHTSEDRVPATAESQEGATILPFERPQSELQRAVQMRAQDHIERIRKREEEKRRPNPLRVAIVMVLAAIPVILIFGAVDKFLTAIQKYTAAMYATPADSAPQPETEQPIESSSQPGMVFLQPNMDAGKNPPVQADQKATQPQQKK
jgi:hypothetical protein